MIIIIIDPYRIKQAQPVFSVSDSESYIRSRVLIREAIRRDENLSITVVNKRLATWYESLRRIDKVLFEVISPRSKLAQDLGVDELLIPPCDEIEIVDLELIQKANTNAPSAALRSLEDVSSWILAVTVDKVWGQSTASLEHFTHLCNFFLSPSGDKKLSSKMLQNLLDERREKWKHSAYGALYRWLLPNNRTNAFLVYSLQIVKNYDNDLKRSITNEILRDKDEKEIAPLAEYIYQLGPLYCDENLPEKKQLSDEVALAWKRTLREKLRKLGQQLRLNEPEKRAADLRKLVVSEIEKMSGYIDGELDAVATIVKDTDHLLSGTLLNTIRVKFFASRNSDIIEELATLVPPQPPTIPLYDWKWDEISKWAVDEYFPYLAWAVRANRINEIVESRASAYSDWLYRNYPKMKNELAPLNYGIWSAIKDRLDSGCYVIWLIIDDLSWPFVDQARKAFEHQGFYVSQPLGIRPVLAMLPSETATSKTALIAGKLPCQIDRAVAYKELFDEECHAKSISSSSFISDSGLRDGMLQDNKITCCMMYELDEKLHNCGFDTVDDIRDTLCRWAGYVKNFVIKGAQRNAIPLDSVRIIISTDHGCCKLPESGKCLNPPLSAEQPLVSSRFVYLHSEEDLNEDWLLLSKVNFGLPKSVAIVRGYSFVGERRPSGFVHGGMTPEETIIPYIEFSPKRMDLKKMQCSYVGDGIRITPNPQNIEVMMKNTNDFEFQNVHIYIPEQNAEIEVESIPPKDQVKRNLSMVLSKEKVTTDQDGYADLHANYEYRCLGVRESGSLNIRIKVKRIMQKPSELEELLGSR